MVLYSTDVRTERVVEGKRLKNTFQPFPHASGPKMVQNPSDFGSFWDLMHEETAVKLLPFPHASGPKMTQNHSDFGPFWDLMHEETVGTCF